MKMQEIDVQDYARQLLEAHGAQAVVRPRKKLLLSKTKAKKTMPRFGGTSKRR